MTAVTRSRRDELLSLSRFFLILRPENPDRCLSAVRIPSRFSINTVRCLSTGQGWDKADRTFGVLVWQGLALISMRTRTSRAGIYIFAKSTKIFNSPLVQFSGANNLKSFSHCVFWLLSSNINLSFLLSKNRLPKKFKTPFPISFQSF